MQYKVNPIMIPFFGIGRDQLAESVVGKPRRVYNVKFMGDDGTGKRHVQIYENTTSFNLKRIQLSHAGYNST